MSAALEVDGLTVAYRSDRVLEDVTFSVASGRLAAVVGPNGAGKTTLLHACLGLVPTIAGNTRILGRPVDDALRDVALVPQVKGIDHDFPVVVLDVVTMGLVRRIGWFRRIGRAHRARALEALERVGMADLASRPIGELSGGQRQRVFVARALVQDARLLLMDEPFTGVDADTEAKLVGVMRELRDDGVTSIVVHHDLGSLSRLFDDAIVLNRRLVAAGPLAESVTPQTLREAYGESLVVLPAPAPEGAA